MIIKKHIQLVGRLGANPTVRILPGGKKIALFSIAVNSQTQSLAGHEVQWHKVCAWNGLASQAESSLFKGMLVTIDGSLLRQGYVTKSGEPRFFNEIIASEFFINP
jgi:single-strand DNA-binding protein